jgi:hypothetical protein
MSIGVSELLEKRQHEYRVLSEDHDRALAELERISYMRCSKIVFDEAGCADRIGEKFWCGPCSARAFVKRLAPKRRDVCLCGGVGCNSCEPQGRG